MKWKVPGLSAVETSAPGVIGHEMSTAFFPLGE